MLPLSMIMVTVLFFGLRLSLKKKKHSISIAHLLSFLFYVGRTVTEAYLENHG